MAARRKKKNIGLRVLGVASLITSVVFVPTSILLGIGMMPTVGAALVDKSGKGVKALTVGAMNLAGTTPFLIDLWTSGNTIAYSLKLVTDPRTIIIIYCAAIAGYLIDWALSGIVAGIILQRGTKRRKDILKRQSDLRDRWGEEVTGEIATDAYGFPIVPERK